MSRNLESNNRKPKEVNEPQENKKNNEKLTEKEKLTEGYDDCAAVEKPDKSNEINKAVKEAEDNYEDCAANEKMKAKVAGIEDYENYDEEKDDYSDCGKETDGRYVAEVTYIDTSDTPKTEIHEELQEAYNDCEDPADMDKLKENIDKNDNLGVEVVNVELVEEPEQDNSVVPPEESKEEFEKAHEKTEKAIEKLEELQRKTDEQQDMPQDEVNNVELQETNEEQVKEKVDEEDNELEDEGQEVNSKNLDTQAKSDDNISGTDEKSDSNENIEEDINGKETTEIKPEKSSNDKVEISEEGIEQNKIDENSELVQKAGSDNLKTEQFEADKEVDLKQRIEDALKYENTTYSELKELEVENKAALVEYERQKNELENILKDKFDKLISSDKKDEAYKQKLAEFNKIKDEKEDLGKKIREAENKDFQLRLQEVKIAETVISEGEISSNMASESLRQYETLQADFDSKFYSVREGTRGYEELEAQNTELIGKMLKEKEAIDDALEMKRNQIRDYVISNNLAYYETSKDQTYQDLSRECQDLQRKSEQLDYSIVKLDDNNLRISEKTGIDYTPLKRNAENKRELQGKLSEIERKEISEKVLELCKPHYDKACEVANKHPELENYSDHKEAHVKMVAEKTQEAADAFETAARNNPLYSHSVNRQELYVASLMHDAGMDGGDSNYRDGEQVRNNHALESALHVLEQRKHLKETLDVDDDFVNAVAIDCLVHSKSCSCVRDLTSDDQWSCCIGKLEKAAKEKGLDFDIDKLPFVKEVHNDSSIKELDKDGKLVGTYKRCIFDEEKMKQVRTSAAAIRLGDANRDSTDTPITQGDKPIKPIIEKETIPFCDKIKDEIKNIKVEVDGKQLDDLKDEKGSARMYVIGENNIATISCRVNQETKAIKEIFKVKNGMVAPNCTKECIAERYRELETIKGMNCEAEIHIDGDYTDEEINVIRTFYTVFALEHERVIKTDTYINEVKQ